MFGGQRRAVAAGTTVGGAGCCENPTKLTKSRNVSSLSLSKVYYLLSHLTYQCMQSPLKKCPATSHHRHGPLVYGDRSPAYVAGHRPVPDVARASPFDTQPLHPGLGEPRTRTSRNTTCPPRSTDAQSSLQARSRYPPTLPRGPRFRLGV